MLKKELGCIDWNNPPHKIKNLVRGITPWPGAFSYLDGKLLKVFRVRISNGTGKPGAVLKADRDGIEIACAEGSLFIEELQLEGKKRLPAAEFLAGCRLSEGMILGAKGTAFEG
jgi:methionyl-tRNA formyltransferase